MSIKNRPLWELATPLFFIFIFEIVSVQLYIFSQAHAKSSGSSSIFIGWITSQTIGGILLGYISDKFQRKKVLLLSQVFAAGIFMWVLASHDKAFNLLAIWLLGFFFNATPTARASLVDNFPQYSKNRLLCYSFLIQFLPWCFFPYFTLFEAKNIYTCIFFFIILNFFLTLTLFKDKFNKAIEYERVITKLAQPGKKRIIVATGAALLLGQLVFFISDYFLEHRSPNPTLYGILGLGSFIGSGMGLVYRKIPHLSLLTMSYGFGFLISAVTFASLFFYEMNISETVILFQVTLYASIGGFYLPLVYETILSSISFKMRGRTCGYIELIISGSSFIALWSVLDKISTFTLLLISTIFFLLALLIQKQGESRA